jgi:hypothetical protein
VAVIADRIALESYRLDWDVVTIRPEDWAMVLTVAPPDLLVVDSATDANGGAWTYRIAWTAHPDFFLQRDLGALVGWCAARAIPTVFRARDEGDTSVGVWADAARLFDLVLTSDEVAASAYGSLADLRGVVGRIPWTKADGESVIRATRLAA